MSIMELWEKPMLVGLIVEQVKEVSSVVLYIIGYISVSLHKSPQHLTQDF